MDDETLGGERESLRIMEMLSIEFAALALWGLESDVDSDFCRSGWLPCPNCLTLSDFLGIIKVCF